MKSSDELSLKAYEALYKSFGHVVYEKMFDTLLNDTDLLYFIIKAVFDVIQCNEEYFLDCFAETYLSYIKETVENEKKN